jgi:hypothetical protein
MIVPDVRLYPCDAAELAEILEFLDDWLASGNDQIHRSLAQFVGHPAYGISQLRSDLNRFAFLLGAPDGQRLFGND